MCSRIRNSVVIVVAVAGFSLLASACGSAGSPGVASVPTNPGATGTSTTNPVTGSFVNAGRCLRQHGLTNFPDPSIATSGPAEGQPILSKQILHNFSNSLVLRALTDCNTVLQKAGINTPETAPPSSPQQIRYMLAFARCVRDHGFPNFPDPNTQGQFDLTGTGINSHALTPAQLVAAKACLPVAHGAVSIPTQGSGTGNGG
jgi:hypothetical protein